jgi:hypothetical protein
LYCSIPLYCSILRLQCHFTLKVYDYSLAFNVNETLKKKLPTKWLRRELPDLCSDYIQFGSRLSLLTFILGSYESFKVNCNKVRCSKQRPLDFQFLSGHLSY